MNLVVYDYNSSFNLGGNQVLNLVVYDYDSSFELNLIESGYGMCYCVIEVFDMMSESWLEEYVNVENFGRDITGYRTY